MAGTLTPRTRKGSMLPGNVPLIRGSAVLPATTWLVQQAGSTEVLGQVFESLPEPLRLNLHFGQPNLGIDPRSWYLPGCADALLAEAERRALPSDRDRYLRGLGAHIMREGINVYYRSMFKLFVSPRAAVENIGTVWERYYNEGRVEAQMAGASGCHATVVGWKGHTVRLCEATAYACLHLLEVTGAQRTMVRAISCRGDRDSGDCQWEFGWTE